MFQHSKILYLFTETPMHAGTGSDLGIIDLPIQREKSTGFPKVESSSLKGCLREAFEQKLPSDDRIHRVFGFDAASRETFTMEGGAFEKKENREFAGCLLVTDARLILFPVKSQRGVFAWITCPRVVSRYLSDLKQAGGSTDDLAVIAEGSVAEDNSLMLNNKTHIGLEEYQFKVTVSKKVNNLGNRLSDALGLMDFWSRKLKTDIVVLSDDDFSDFVKHSTEVVTRTKIDNETGTVTDSALFTEEYLPAESLMYSVTFFSPEFARSAKKLTADEVAHFFTENLPPVIQLGGNASLGKGITRTKI